IEDKRARGGLMDAREEVQERRLAGAVGADQREDRALLDLDGGVVHRAHPAEALVKLLCLEESRHASWCLKAIHACSIPPGMNSTASVSATPSIMRRSSPKPRSNSGRKVSPTAPITGPIMVPMPPTITIAIMVKDSTMPKASGTSVPTKPG